MATVEMSKKDVLIAYADEQYKKLQREKDQYVSLDEYCAKLGHRIVSFSSRRLPAFHCPRLS